MRSRYHGCVFLSLWERGLFFLFPADGVSSAPFLRLLPPVTSPCKSVIVIFGFHGLSTAFFAAGLPGSRFSAWLMPN